MDPEIAQQPTHGIIHPHSSAGWMHYTATAATDVLPPIFWHIQIVAGGGALAIIAGRRRGRAARRCHSAESRVAATVLLALRPRYRLAQFAIATASVRN